MIKKSIKEKMSKTLSLTLIAVTVMTSIPFSNATMVNAAGKSISENSLDALSSDNAETLSIDDTDESINNNDLDAQSITFSNSGKQINSYQYGASSDTDAIATKISRYCGSMIYNDNSITPCAVQDGYYIWFNGDKEKIDGYTDKYLGTFLPLKDKSDVLKAQYNFYTSNGGESIETVNFNKIYRQNKGSSDVQLVRELPANKSLLVYSGYEHGSYLLAYDYNTKDVTIYYDIDGTEYSEKVAENIVDKTSIVASLLKDGYLYYLDSNSHKLVRHKLGEDISTDVSIDMTDASNFSSSASMLSLKGSDKIFIFKNQLCYYSQYCYIADFDSNTITSDKNTLGYWEINDDETILTCTNPTYSTEYTDESHSKYNYIYRYKTYSNDTMSEWKMHKGHYYDEVLMVNNTNDDSDALVGYASSQSIYMLYRNNNCELFNWVTPYKVTCNCCKDTINVIIDNYKISTNDIKKYDTSSELFSYQNFRNDDTRIKAVDNDCENGIYVEMQPGNIELLPIEGKHYKGSYNSNIPATCSTHSIDYYDCKICGKEKTFSVEGSYYDTTAHSSFYDESNIIKQPTCTEKGQRGFKCKFCNKEVYRTEEEYGEGYTGRTVIRDERGNRLEGYYDEITDIPALGHDLDSAIISEATCNENGIHRFYCNKCDYYEDYVINAKGHDMEISEIIVEPTCTKTGYGKAICKNCGYTLKRYAIDKIEHDWELINEEYNESTNKLIRKYKCTECDKIDERVLNNVSNYSTISYASEYKAGLDGTGVIEYKGDNESIQDSLNNMATYYINDGDSLEYHMQTSTQQIKSLSKDAYSKVKINNQSITDFLNIDSSVEPTVLSTDSLTREFDYGVYYVNYNVLGAWAIPSNITIQGNFNNVDVTVRSEESTWLGRHELRDTIYTIVNIKDDKYTKLYIKDAYDSDDVFSAKETDSVDCFIQDPPPSEYDSCPIYKTSKYTVYKLSESSDEELEYIATEVDQLNIVPFVNNYYLIVAKPDIDGIKNITEQRIARYTAYADESEIPNLAIDGASSTMAYGFNIVSDVLLPSRDYYGRYSSDYNSDELNKMLTGDYVEPIISKSDISNKVSYDLSVKVNLPDDKLFDTYVGINNTAEPDDYNGTYLCEEVSGKITIFKKDATLEPTKNASQYYDNNYENGSNTVVVPAKDWLFKEPVFSWSIINDDGTETPVTNNQIIDDIKYFVTDTSIRAETTKNITEELEINIMCTIHDNYTGQEKYHMGALKFQNLEADLDVDTSELGNEATISDNTITVKSGKSFKLKVTPKYIKENTGDSVDTTETINWFFKEKDSGKVYLVDPTSGSMTEYNGNLDIDFGDEDDDVNTAIESEESSIKTFFSNLFSKADNLFTTTVHAADPYTITLTPNKNGKLAAVFNGRYGSTQQVFNILIGKYAVGIDVTYDGGDVLTGTEYPISGVHVFLKYSDGTTSSELSQSEWTVNSRLVRNEGTNNNFTVTHTSTGFTNDFNVKGIRVQTGIVASYEGEEIIVGNTYSKSDVEVRKLYHDGTTSATLLSDSEWEVVGNNFTVSTDGINTFTAKEITTSFTDDFNVNGITLVKIPIKINAEYNGPDIPVGEEYEKRYVDVTVTYSDNTTRALGNNEWEPNDLRVRESGYNQFRATYKTLEAGYEVKGILVPKELYAIYHGDKIPVGNKYNKSDVEVRVRYHDGSFSEPLSENEWNESSLTVTYIGMNEFKAYYDNLHTTYEVDGISNLLRISAVYKGHNIPIGERYDKRDVDVTAYYSDGTTRLLDIDDWTESSLTVEEIGKNSFTASYEGLEAEYNIKGILEAVELVAIYKGPDIEVGHDYKKEDVKVTVYYHNGVYKELNTKQWGASDITVTKVGDNVFTAYYKELECGYVVNGYQVINIPGPTPPIVVHTGIETLVPVLIILIIIACGLSLLLIKKKREVIK